MGIMQVRKDQCLGCGVCLDSCPRGAILISRGQAQIDQRRCNQCRACIASCPQDAIVELAPVSRGDLMADVATLRARADDILARIEALQNKGGSSRLDTPGSGTGRRRPGGGISRVRLASTRGPHQGWPGRRQ